MLLTEIAAELFKEYSRKENSKASWHYLPIPRKLEWMKETVIVCDRILTKVENEIKPLGPASIHDNSYAIGFRAAQLMERENFKKIITETKERLIKELEIFKDK